LAAIAVLILVTAGALAVKKLTAPPETVPADTPQIPETTRESAFKTIDSIPSGASDARLFMQVSDTRSLTSFISWMSDVASRVSSGDIAKTIGVLNSLRNIADASEEIVVYATPEDIPQLYVSLSADDEKFDSIIENAEKPGRNFHLEKWAGNSGDGEDAWILKAAGGGSDGLDFLYMTRRHAGGVSLVNASPKADAIEKMREASRDPSKRLSLARRTEGANHIQVNFAEPLNLEGFSLSAAETSWSRDDRRIHIESYSDLFDNVTLGLANRSFTPGAIPILGEGELVLLASVDPAFFISASLPLESDPIKYAVWKHAASIPAFFPENVEAILRNCRLSAVVISKGTEISAGYLVLDTEATDSLDKIFGAVLPLFGSEVKVDGWDSAYLVPAGGAELLVARGSRMLLVGVGDVAEYGKKMETQADIAAAASAGVLGMRVSSELFSLKAPGMTETLGEIFNRLGGYDVRGLILKAQIEKVERLSMSQSLDGLGNIEILLK